MYNIKHFNYAAYSNGTRAIVRANENELSISYLEDNKLINYPDVKYKPSTSSVIDAFNTVVTCTRSGAQVYDINHPDSVLRHLPGITVSNVFERAWGGQRWFCTLGNEVYRLDSIRVKIFDFRSDRQQDNQGGICFIIKLDAGGYSTREILLKLSAGNRENRKAG